jgi:uncharacterized protein YbjQ (UPF0145 family)
MTTDRGSKDARSAGAQIGTALDALRSPFHPATKETFLSDLSVGELILLEDIGYEAVEIVSGAGSGSWYPQFTTAGTESAFWADAIAGSIAHARDQIFSEVSQVGADGVVAMHVDLEREPANLLTCSMLGTAVRRMHPKGGHSDRQHSRNAAPFTTTLSTRDFHLLERAGYSATGIVFGTSVVGFAARSAAQSLGIARENIELEGQTNALYSARERAMEKMEREANHLGADGVVAVELSERPVNTMLTHAVELLVIGTAVRRSPEGHRSLKPQLQLTLNDPAPDVFQTG